MSTKIRYEEHTVLGDFIKASYVRDQEVIVGRFPKLGSAYMDLFNDKLDAVRVLQSRKVLTEEQKSITASLYTEAAEIKTEMGFLSTYLSDAKLSTGLVTELKYDLTSHNIEGAISKLEAIKQFITPHTTALTEEGMSPGFSTQLEAYKTSLTNKNNLQNEMMNTGKKLVEANSNEYNELYAMIQKIANAGKLIFAGTVTEDEYSLTKVLRRMRAPHQNQKPDSNNPS